jgi:hypothetical protein
VSGVVLYIINNNADVSKKEDRVACELEFEHAMVAISWDHTSKCVVLGDAKGALHLVTRSGHLLFSKNVTG